MIRDIRIENLRGIRECAIAGLTDVNILIGRNGSGKSTVLEAIYLASSWVSEWDAIRGVRKEEYVVSRRGGRGDWGTLKATLWFLKDTKRDPSIVLRFNTGKELKFKLLYEHGKPVWLELTPEVMPEVDELKHTYGLESPCSRADVGLYDPGKRVAVALYRDVLEKLEKLKARLSTELEFLNNVVLLDHGLSVEAVEKSVWPQLLDRRLDKVIVSLVREEYEPGAEDIIYKPLVGGFFVLALKLPETTIEIDALGDGARKAILFASALALAESTAVLIEDPEVHQHPAGLGAFMRLTAKVAKERRLQLFITTHSIELVNIARRVCGDLGLKLKVFYMERDQGGIVDVRELEEVDIDIAQKLGLDPRLLHIL